MRWPLLEGLESRMLMSGSNALDRIDFGNASSESAHSFDSGFSTLPLSGTGALGQTFRAPVGVAGSGNLTAGSDELQFTLAVDPNKQNYLTIRLWGNDRQSAGLFLLGTPANYGALDWSSGPSPFPNRFYYDTVPIPISTTQGRTSLQLTLYETNTPNTTLPARPVYSAYTHVDPNFMPDGNDPTGSALAQTGQITPTTLTTPQVISLLQTERQSIYGSGGYYDQTLANQIMPGQAGAPKETVGLDLWTNVTNWASSHPGATPDQWRDQTGGGGHGPGYSTVPDELLSVLTSTYLLQPFKDANGNVVAGLDHYHDSSIIQRIVYALDGSTYLQSSDGSYQAQPNPDWQGLTSTPRAAGHPYAGSTARGSGWSISLEGVDASTLGSTILQLLDDSTAAPIFKTYLSQSYDADLNGGSVLRAHAYERMLNNQIEWQKVNEGGGTVSQAQFNVSSLYTNEVALTKLEALYPYGSNSSAFTNVTTPYTMPYPAVTASQGVEYLKEVTGVVPVTSLLGNLYRSGQTNYAISTAGFGEAHGSTSGGYDGRYGTILPWLNEQLAQVAAVDPAVDSTTLSKVRAQAKAAADAYEHFISPNENFNGVTDQFTLAQEDFITYRDPYNPNANAGGFNVGTGYWGSDPATGIGSAYEARAAYLEALYGITPGTGKGGNDQLIYLNSLASYEATLRNLANVSPSSIAALPGEPGQPNSAFIDPQTGATAIYFNGERFYMNANWRNYENGGNNYGTVSELARIHDTTSTVDKAALAFHSPQ